MKIKAANAPVTFEETIMVLITNDVVRLSKMTLSRTLHAVGVDKGAKLNGWLRLQCLYYKQVFDAGRLSIEKQEHISVSHIYCSLARSQCLRVAHAQVTQLQSLKRSHG